jgi:heterodisulfide reductase subunit B
MPAHDRPQPPLTYLYFPGCSLKGTGVAYDESFVALFRLLSLPLEELPDWNCCGATSYAAIGEETAFVLAARNLAIAQRLGALELIAPCSACYLVLRKTIEYSYRYPEVRQQIQEAMARAGLPFPDARIAAAVKRRWSGGRVACYYGCQVVRPYAEVDDAYGPTRMDELLAAAGIPTVDYPVKTQCCGGSLTGTIAAVGKDLNSILLQEAERQGAQAIVTICPLCQFNLDIHQGEIRAGTGASFDMPILLLPQILGWALGGEWRALGLHRAISGRRLLEQWLDAPAERDLYA